MKCNPSQPIVKILAALGTGFDCASAEEIRIAKELNVPNSKIIFANPCKSKVNILKARQEGIKMMTFDNVDELRKVHSLFPEAEMVLRILPDDSHSLMKFGTKFGAPSESWEELFTEANKLGIKIIGVSFHVGSGCFDAIAYAHALSLARSAFDMASTYGFDFTLLDIGGGFPGSTDTSLTFPEIAEVLRPTLDELFPASMGVKIIAEPGRYFAQACLTLATSIHSKRAYREGDGSKCFKYYVGDGVYGSFNCIMFDHANPKPRLLREEIHSDSSSESESESEERMRYSSTIFGPTCDSMDRIVNQTLLPELAVGEWIYFENMGAYTTAAASGFNGFHSPSSFYVLENTSLS
jgi:ornithine decarboxylase